MYIHSYTHTLSLSLSLSLSYTQNTYRLSVRTHTDTHRHTFTHTDKTHGNPIMPKANKKAEIRVGVGEHTLDNVFRKLPGVCIRVCAHVRACGLCVYECVRACAHTCVRVYMQTHAHACFDTCVHRHMRASTHACIDTCVHACIQTRQTNKRDLQHAHTLEPPVTCLGVRTRVCLCVCACTCTYQETTLRMRSST